MNAKKTLMIWIMVIMAGITITSASGQEMVRATGVATINNGVVDIARDKAIENALRSAVEEKIGVMIKSYTEVENYELKMDQILSESKGFVNSYRIVSEGREGNTYKVVD